MSQIQKLSQSIINKIAAGEVIERPAAVVKELMENALDAGASRIEVSVDKGGDDLIRVTDNGSGIPADQLNLAVAAHATSKIQDADDLFKVGTMGFRGEALASIAEISRFRIRSRVADQTEGALIEVLGGETGEIVPCGCPVGTTVEVINLFYNTPVRKRFMKSPTTEFSYITEQFYRVAIPNNTIGFKLVHNGKTVADLMPSQSWQQRIADVFGKEIADHLIEISFQFNNISVNGYVVHPSVNRTNNKFIYMFLNGRYIRDKGLYAALQEAYRGVITSGRFPIAFLALNVPYDMVDINVHPCKLEVRFQDSNRVFSAVLSSIRNAFLVTDLRSHVSADNGAGFHGSSEPVISPVQYTGPPLSQQPNHPQQNHPQPNYQQQGQQPGQFSGPVPQSQMGQQGLQQGYQQNQYPNQLPGQQPGQQPNQPNQQLGQFSGPVPLQGVVDPDVVVAYPEFAAYGGSSSPDESMAQGQIRNEDLVAQSHHLESDHFQSGPRDGGINQRDRGQDLRDQYNRYTGGVPAFKPFGNTGNVNTGNMNTGNMNTGNPGSGNDNPGNVHANHGSADAPSESFSKRDPGPSEGPDQVSGSDGNAGGTVVSPDPAFPGTSFPEPALPPLGPAIQIQNRYIITELPEGLAVIDQHALHERIMYERIKKSVELHTVQSQQLLVPIPVDFSPVEFSQCMDHRQDLAKFGFHIDPFGGQTVLLTAYPALLSKHNPEPVLRELVDKLNSQGKQPETVEVFETLYHSMACKAAVKAGAPMTQEEITALLTDMRQCEDPHHCPHGRPSILIFSQEELDKMFRRT